MAERECFGILQEVFPEGEAGLREVRAGCFACPERKGCLQEALATREGLEFRDRLLDRSAERGVIGFFRRWSEKKSLARLIREGAKEP